MLHLRRVDDSFDKYVAMITASFEDVLPVCLRAAPMSTSSTFSARFPPTTSPTSPTTAWSLAARARDLPRRLAGAGTFRTARLPFHCLQFVGGMREYVDYNMLSPGGAWAPDRRLTSARSDASHFSSSFLRFADLGTSVVRGTQGTS